MKQKLFLLFVLVFTFVQSQQHIDTGVASQTNTVFSLLEKNRVPHGILLDYGYDFVSIPNYDGVLRDNNYITPSIYRNLYAGILSSRTTTSVPELEAPDNLEAGWKNKQKSEANRVGAGSAVSTLVLNGLYYKYARFRSDALATNKIQVVNNKYDDVYVNGTWQNPYETDDAFAMTLPVKSTSNSTVSLMLHPDNWYTNQSSSIDNFAVNFGDGSGYKALSIGSPLVHTYNTDGNFTITYRMRLTNGQYLYCRNKLIVEGGGQKGHYSCTEHQL